MQVQLESTSKIVDLVIDGNRVPARIWEGVTANGVRCHAYICDDGYAVGTVKKTESVSEKPVPTYGEAIADCVDSLMYCVGWSPRETARRKLAQTIDEACRLS